MFGILVVAHGDLAKLLLETAKKILQEDFQMLIFTQWIGIVISIKQKLILKKD